MKSKFPQNIPVLESDEQDVDFIYVVFYPNNTEKELKAYFEKN